MYILPIKTNMIYLNSAYIMSNTIQFYSIKNIYVKYSFYSIKNICVKHSKFDFLYSQLVRIYQQFGDFYH